MTAFITTGKNINANVGQRLMMGAGFSEIVLSGSRRKRTVNSMKDMISRQDAAQRELFGNSEQLGKEEQP